MRPFASPGPPDAPARIEGLRVDVDASLFQLANVAVWIGDLAALKARVDAWRAAGVTDASAYLRERPDEAADCVRDMRMVDCNECAVELVQGRSVADALDGYPRLFLPESYAALTEELQAILDRRRRFEFEATIRTLRGERRRLRMGVRFPETAGGWTRVVVSMLDVTASTLVQDALRSSEERFQLASRAVQGHIYDLDVVSGHVWRSEGLREIVGWDADEAAPHAAWWHELVHADDRKHARTAGVVQLRGGADTFSTRYRVRHRDGHWVHVWDRALAVRDAHGTLVRVVGSVMDVTAEEQAFLALGESRSALEAAEERSRLALEAARLGTFDYDLRTDSLLWDARCRELFGVGPDFVPTYEAFMASVADEDRPRVETILGTVLDSVPLQAAVARYQQEFHVVGLESGEERIVRAFGQITLAEGRPLRVVGTVQDVTALTRADTQFRAFADSMPHLAWTTARDGEPQFLNRRWYEYTGLARTQDGAEVFGDAIHPDDRERAHGAWRVAAAQGVEYETEFRLRRADGAYRWFLARGVPQHDGRGHVVQWFGTCTDVDESKRLEQQLRSNEQNLREADRRKDEFLATLAHELRNPLAPVRSAARILESPQLSARELGWCRDVIRRQVQHMALLLDDLLDVSRITRGKLELRREAVAVRDVVEAAVETARPLLDSRRHTLEVDLAPGLPTLAADPMRLAQVLANLLTNAAKYTDPGGHVALQARVVGGELRLAVRDTGIGLAPEARARVFEMFSQVQNALDRSEGGLGIGLALVRGLVELHGGRVEAQSDGLGRGSEFVVLLPVATAAHASAPAPEPATGAAAAAACRVLVADDNRDAAECLALLLRFAGHDVRTVHDGRTALAVAAEFAPHAVVLDIGMPELNGYEVATRLRAESWGRDVVLVAVTGWGQDGDKRLAHVAGFDHHLTKPVDPETIEALLADAGARARARRAPSPPDEGRLL